MPWLQQRTAQTISWTASAELLSKQNRILVIRATVCTEELAKVHQCTAAHIKTEKELLEEHSKKLAKHLQNNEGIWLSSRWLVFMIITQGICYIAIILWAFSK